MPIKRGLKSCQCSGTKLAAAVELYAFFGFLLSKCFEKRIIYCNFTKIKKNL